MTLFVLLHLLLAAAGLTVIVAPLAAHVRRELAPASRTRYGFRPAFAVGGSW